MWCRACGYDLRDLEHATCPECGRAFDPDDRTSFAPTPPPSPEARRLGLIETLSAIALGAPIFTTGALLIAVIVVMAAWSFAPAAGITVVVVGAVLAVGYVVMRRSAGR